MHHKREKDKVNIFDITDKFENKNIAQIDEITIFLLNIFYSLTIFFTFSFS